MGPETFTVCKLLRRKGEDGLPHHVLQMDVEEVSQDSAVSPRHIVRHFVDVGSLVLLLKEEGII